MLTNKDFFADALDVSIPELAEAKAAFLSGDLALAEKRFADYVRANLEREKYFELPSVKKHLVRERDSAVAAADRISEFHLGAVGFPHDYEPWNVDWSLNPTPNNYGEYVWQFSRFNMVIDLAVAYQYEKKPIYEKVFAYLLDSWIDQQPFPVVQADQHAGSYELVGWRTIESGIRMHLAWPLGICTFIGSPALTDHLITKIFMSVWEHGFHLEHYCSDHNWLVIEMMGLFNMATVFPFFHQSKHWRDFAFDMLYHQLDEQIYPEGIQYELATGYHVGVTNDYLKVVEEALVYGIEVPKKMLDRLHDMHTCIVKILQPDRTIPDLNDGTSASYLPNLRYALRYYPDDPAFRYFTSDGKEGSAPAYNSVSLETAGIGIMRSGWAPSDTWAMLESAHFGWGHQHEDKLAFNLYAYGKRMLEDGGQYEYDTSKMRAMICSTRAHNTALVDTFGQARMRTYSRAEEERYVREKIPSDLFWNYGGEEYEIAEGSYKFGYGPDAAVKVDHHRKVIWFKKGLPGTLPFFVLIDRFAPRDDGEHLYEVLFQLGVQPIETSGRTITQDFGDGVTMSLIGSVDPNVIIGQYEPRYMGWKKNRSKPGVEIEHFKAPAILFTDKAKADHIVTVVYPNNRGDMPIASVSASDASEKSRRFTITLADNRTFTFDEDDDLFAAFDRDGNRCSE